MKGTRVARLWELVWDDRHRLACSIYRTDASLQLTLEAGDTVVLDEAFRMEPRALSRAEALRTGLKRRGWREPA